MKRLKHCLMFLIQCSFSLLLNGFKVNVFKQIKRLKFEYKGYQIKILSLITLLGEMNYLCTLILLIYLNILNIHTQTSGVIPTQRVTNLPYIQIQQTTLLATVLTGTPSFTNATTTYSIIVALMRAYNDIGQHNLVTTDYESIAVNGELGYTLKSIINTNPTSAVELQWGIIGGSQLKRLKVTLVITIANLFNYMQIMEATLLNPLQTKYFVSLSTTNFFIAVKSFITKYTGTLPATAQSQGFKTIATKSTDTTQSTSFQVYFEKTPANGSFTVSVTYVVFWINPTEYKKTAQFSNLQYSSVWDYNILNQVSFTPAQFNPLYISDMLFGIPSMQHIITLNSYYRFNITATGVTYSHNGINGIFQYMIMNFKDSKCPTTSPYKYKADTLCYSCPNLQMILVNGDSTWSELNPAFTNEKCIRLDLKKTGYEFSSVTGEIVSVCGYCKNCTVAYYLQLGVCKFCSNKITNCMQCSSNVTCTKCQVGYKIVDPDNNTATLNNACQSTIVQQNGTAPTTIIDPPTPPIDPIIDPPTPSIDPIIDSTPPPIDTISDPFFPPPIPSEQTNIIQLQKSNRTRMVIGIVVGVILLLILVISIFLLKKYLKQSSKIFDHPKDQPKQINQFEEINSQNNLIDQINQDNLDQWHYMSERGSDIGIDFHC